MTPSSTDLRREDAATRPPLPWWPAVFGALLTGAVAFWGLATPQYWFDEAASVSAVDRPFGSLIAMVQKVDAVHALYYVVMYPWAALFGTSELAMRTPSALALVVMSVFLTRIGMAYARRYMPERTVFVGVMVAVLGAVLPGLSWTGQEARGYAMGAMSLTIAWWFFERFREHRHTPSLVGFALFMAAGVGFSLYVAMLLPLFFARSLRWGRRNTVKVLVACLVAGSVCIPLVIVGAEQSGQVSWIDATTREVLRRMALMVFFLSPRNRFGAYNGPVEQIAPWLGLFTILVVALGLIRSRARWIMLWLLSLVLLPFVVILVAQLLGKQYFQERYLTFTAPVLVVALALGLAAIPWRPVGALGLALFTLLSFPSFLGQNGEFAKKDGYKTAAVAAAQADTVIFMDDEARGIFVAYPPDHPVKDPMLAQNKEDSATLWGQNHPGWWSWQLDETGKVSVVAFKPNPYYGAVLEHLDSIGCTITDENLESRFRVTNLQCPDTLAQPARTPVEPGT